MKSQLTGLDGHVDGWAWLALTIVVWLWTPAFFKSPAMLTVVVLALDVALPCIALKDIGRVRRRGRQQAARRDRGLGAARLWLLGDLSGLRHDTQRRFRPDDTAEPKTHRKPQGK